MIKSTQEQQFKKGNIFVSLFTENNDGSIYGTIRLGNADTKMFSTAHAEVRMPLQAKDSAEAMRILDNKLKQILEVMEL
jgi:hypothetical protein